MEDDCCVPPGFRFHPTEEELVGYYLARKVASQSIDLDIIQEVDLYRMEPWDLIKQQGQGGGDEWYFFSYKDRKYPSGTRTNRATAAGFWKATGRDKPVLSSSSGSSRVIGMRKTLVFYKGRAPNGRKTDWIMHEYRLIHSSDNGDDHRHSSRSLLIMPPSSQCSQQEEGWVVCRAFRKPIPNHQQQQVSLVPYHQHPNIPSSTTGYGFLLGSTSTTSSLPLFYPPQAGGEILSQSQAQQLYPAANHAEADGDALFHESKNKQHLLLSIPQLIDDSPIAAAAAIDWNFLDTLLLSSTALHDPASSESSLQLQ